MPGTVSFSPSNQCWLIRQRLLKGATSPPLPLPLLWYAAPPNNHIRKYVILGYICRELLFSVQIFTRNIKKMKSGNINMRHKGILNKHLNPVFYEHSNAEERIRWIRLLNKLNWLKMQVMFTFFATTFWNIH